MVLASSIYKEIVKFITLMGPKPSLNVNLNFGVQLWRVMQLEFIFQMQQKKVHLQVI